MSEILLFVLALGIVVSSVQCVQAKQCQNVLPGIKRIGRGVDITTLDLFPAELLLKNLFAHDLFDFSCDSDKTWTNPALPDAFNSVPDQVAAINTIPVGVLNIKVKLNQDMDEYKNSIAEKVGVELDSDSFGYFSNSKSQFEVMELMEKLNKSVIETSTYTSAVQIDLKPSTTLKLSDRFVDFVENILPVKYELDPELYDEFLDTFGTHYFQSGIVGGYLYQRTVVGNGYLNKVGFKDISANVKTTFTNSAGIVQQGKAYKNVATNDMFRSNTETSFFFYGGMTDLLTTSGNSRLIQWSISASQDPWLFAGKLKSVESLIRNSTIKSQVKKAVQVKLARAYLKEVSNKVKNSGLEDSQYHQASLRSIDAMLKNPQKSNFSLAEIVKNIEDLSNEIQLYKDRAYLQEFELKLGNAFDDVFWCKFNISSQCSSKNKENMVKQNNQIRSLQTQFHDFLAKKTIPRKQVQTLILETSKLIEQHQMTQLNLCNDDLQCLSCLQKWASNMPNKCKNSVFMPLLKNSLPWLKY